jgi:hypothetical protein
MSALGMTSEELEAALERAWQRSLEHQGLDPDWKPPAAVIAKVATIAKAAKGAPNAVA